MTDAGLKVLAQSKSLDNVALFGTKKVTDAGVKELAALPKLQTLDLAFFTLDDSAFDAFARPKTLTSITFEYIDGLTDDGVKHAAPRLHYPALSPVALRKGFVMRETHLTIPELAMIAGTRVALGAGLGLLLGNRLTNPERRTLGWALALSGAVSTIPLASRVLSRSRSVPPAWWSEMGMTASSR